MKIQDKLLLVATSLTLALAGQSAFGQQLDSKGATVSLEVGKFAKINNLNDFVLTSLDDGDEGAVYAGFDMFNVESNAPVLVEVSGGNLAKGDDYIPTVYKLDDQASFQTGTKHNGEHKISAEATLGNISAQEAGGYSADITITVSAI